MALNVKLLRLTSGEEILAELLNYVEGDSKVKIKKPVRVIVMPNKADPKVPTVAFTHWMEFVDDSEFTLDKTHVLVICNPVKEFLNQYNSMFGGIITPSNSNKLLLSGT